MFAAAWSRGVVSWGLALLLLGCAVTLAVACGEKNDKKPKKVKISVVVILASEKGGNIDKKLECIAKEVQKMHPKLTNFELDNLSCKSLELGKLDQLESEIAKELSLSVKTISTYRTRILEKMGLRNNAELMHYAMQHQLVE